VMPGADMGVLESILKRIQVLQGMKDSRGPQGIFSRGANVYNAGSLAAQRGGGIQYGRYPAYQQSASRRLFG
jgi:hypothetical protein